MIFFKGECIMKIRANNSYIEVSVEGVFYEVKDGEILEHRYFDHLNEPGHFRDEETGYGYETMEDGRFGTFYYIGDSYTITKVFDNLEDAITFLKWRACNEVVSFDPFGKNLFMNKKAAEMFLNGKSGMFVDVPEMFREFFNRVVENKDRHIKKI